MSKEVEELFKQEHEVKSYKQSCFNGVKEIEYHCGQIVTDDIFSKEEMIAFAKFCADERIEKLKKELLDILSTHPDALYSGEINDIIEHLKQLDHE